MPRYWDFEITLLVARRTWRRFLIRKSASFAELHLAIQDAFEWQNTHLFEFRNPGDLKRVVAGIPDDENAYTPDARRTAVRDRIDYRFYGSTWFEYEYDFGDGWIHEVKLRGEVTVAEAFKRRLVDGERSAPPEDCGGPPGYERLLSDPGNWNPEQFDFDALRARFDRATGSKRPTNFSDN